MNEFLKYIHSQADQGFLSFPALNYVQQQSKQPCAVLTVLEYHI